MKILDIKQNTDEWDQARAGIVTGSNAKHILNASLGPSKSVNEFAQRLACEKFAGKPLKAFFGNHATEWGHVMEPESKLWYEMTYDCSLLEWGFVMLDDGSAGCSPDAIRSDDGGCLDYKNLQADAHLKILNRYKADPTNLPPDNKPQALFNAYITDAPYTDIIYYNSVLPKIVYRYERTQQTDASVRLAIQDVNQRRDEFLKVLQEMDKNN